MARFRKKPVEIEALRVPEPISSPGSADKFNHVAWWCNGRTTNDAVYGPVILIDTLEGEMRAMPGDWIIKGVKGEFYPCKPDIFEQTYDPVEF